MRLSCAGALWILVALAGCTSDAEFLSAEPGVETGAWESGESSELSSDGRLGVTAAVEMVDSGGVDSSSTSTGGSAPGLLSDPLSSDLSSSTNTNTCSASSASMSSTPSSSPATTSASGVSSTSSSQGPDSSTPSQTSSPTLTTTSSPTTTGGTSSAGALDPSGPCGSMPFDAAWLRQKLAEFTGDAPTTLLGAPARIGERNSVVGRANARTWLAEQYGRLGYRLDGHDYPGGTNVFAERKGSGDGVIIVSSHYDTVAGTVGADDDGSGVAVGLAVAAALARCQPGKTVRMIAFDQEEKGMIGSRAYVRSLRDSGQAQNIAGVIQVEMAGYDQNNDGYINRVDCGHRNNRFIVDALSSTIANERLGLTAVGECQGRSDHVSFWDANIPALTISEYFFGNSRERNPCYHRSCDTVNNLNFNFMNKIARAVALTTIALSDAK